MSKNLKVVLLTEKSSHEFKVVDKDNYILEGIFAIFGRENVNHRIYEENEYLPHLEYLQEKIKRNKLAGELDHPEKFDVSLSNISHLVEKLWYDKESRTLKGRIRILDTDPAGLNARKLVDSGFPISISSRAAGVVKENKEVQIKRIFTYDLVADGGFGNDAELTRVYESAGIVEDNHLPLVNSDLGFTNDDQIKIYDVTEKYPELIEEGADFSAYDYSITKKQKTAQVENISENKAIYNKNNQSSMENKKEPVSTEEMYRYSVHVKDEMKKFETAISDINAKIEKLVESNSVNTVTDRSADKIAMLEKEIVVLKGYSNKLSQYLSDTINYVEMIGEDHNWLADYTERLVEDHNHLANYTESIAEDHNHVAKYAEKIAEDHNYVAGYVNEKIRPLLEKNIAYSEKIAEEANYGLNYAEDVLAKELHETQAYVNDVITDRVNKLWNYQDYMAEKQNQIFNYAEYLGENAATREDLENVIGFAEEISENQNIANGTNVNESVNTENTILSKYTSLGNKIDNILESIKTTRMNPINEHIAKYPFLKDFDGDQAKKFISFTDVQKEQFAKSIDESNQLNKDQMIALFETVSTESMAPKNPLWMEKMPEEYKGAWEQLDENAKSQIVAQSNLYPLTTDYQITNFWQTRGLSKVEKETSLNESAKQTSNSTESTLGYSREYMDRIKSSLDRFSK